jgi:hypothetical protein
LYVIFRRLTIRYNRTINEHFPCAHPGLIQFIHVIREESIQYAQDVNLVKVKAKAAPNHAPAKKYPVPREYLEFIYVESARS